MSTGRSVRFTFYLFMSLLLLSIFILLSEVYFRIADRYGREGVTWISDQGVTGIEYSPIEIWRWRKLMSDQITNSEGETFTVHTDQFGFRNYGHPLTKPADVIRILILGDSYTSALNIGDDKTFQSLLEKKLSDLRPAGEKIEVLSASSPAWSTEQQLLCLSNEAMQLQPDHVLLMTCPNDIREAWCKKFATPDPHGRPQFHPIPLSRTEIFLWWLSNHSRVFQFIQQRILHTRYGTFAQLETHYSFHFGRDDSQLWDRPVFLTHPYPEADSAIVFFDSLITSMQQYCDQQKIHFTLSLTPTLMEFNGTIGSDSTTQSGIVSDRLKTFCSSRGLDYINLYDQFKSEPKPAACFMSPDAHFSSHGHQVTADKLAEYYRDYFKNIGVKK